MIAVRKVISMNKYCLKNLDCASCADKIEKTLSRMPDVKFVSVNFANSTMQIDTPDIESVRRKIKEIEPDVVIEGIIGDEYKLPKIQTSLRENKNELAKILATIILLAFGIIFNNELHNTPYRFVEFLVFLTAYFLSGWGVIRGAITSLVRGKVFNEHFLMTVATVGALAIDAMPEAVAVMLFYIVGELFQSIAINRSRKSIQAILEIRPEYANLEDNNGTLRVAPSEVHPGQSVVVKPGEKIPLDGIILAGTSYVDTSPLTGESVPREVNKNDAVLAGMINKSGLLRVKVTKEFNRSSVAKILELVENASSKKAESEKFITTFARYYTPIVVLCALMLSIIPPILISGAHFSDWLYRALVVLVISCPCALVISIPLGYFGGIGGASRRGILVKGSNFLDALTHIKIVVFDKTGTLTKGEFKVAEIVTANGFTPEELLKYSSYAESNSSHPIAKSIMDAYGRKIERKEISTVEEISGYGIHANISGDEVLIGNDSLLHKKNIAHDKCDVDGTVVHVVINKKYAGYIVISDSLKHDAIEAINALKALKIKTVMLTGDNKSSAELFAKKLAIDEYYYELLPEKKVERTEKYINSDPKGKVAFVGDGINDSPVIARADIGIAMGALGSDAAVETADVVLMADSPMQVVKAINIAKKTRRIVWENIAFAMGVKLLFIFLGTLGIASMWEAVFADMGVAIIAILNAVRVYN